MRGRDIESRAEKSNPSFPAENRDKSWISWLIPMFVAANIAMFVLEMYLNNCPKRLKNRGDDDDKCVARFLGRFSFQPLRENPLFGPSSST